MSRLPGTLLEPEANLIERLLKPAQMGPQTIVIMTCVLASRTVKALLQLSEVTYTMKREMERAFTWFQGCLSLLGPAHYS
jgi:hypothetical protein